MKLKTPRIDLEQCCSNGTSALDSLGRLVKRYYWTLVPEFLIQWVWVKWEFAFPKGPKWCWCCCSRDSTLRTTGPEMLALLKPCVQWNSQEAISLFTSPFCIPPCWCPDTVSSWQSQAYIPFRVSNARKRFSQHLYEFPPQMTLALCKSHAHSHNSHLSTLSGNLYVTASLVTVLLLTHNSESYLRKECRANKMLYVLIYIELSNIFNFSESQFTFPVNWFNNAYISGSL